METRRTRRAKFHTDTIFDQLMDAHINSKPGADGDGSIFSSERLTVKNFGQLTGLNWPEERVAREIAGLLDGFTEQQQVQLVYMRNTGRAVSETISFTKEFDGSGDPEMYPVKNKQQIAAKLIDMFGDTELKAFVAPGAEARADRRAGDLSPRIYKYQDGAGRVTFEPEAQAPAPPVAAAPIFTSNNKNNDALASAGTLDCGFPHAAEVRYHRPTSAIPDAACSTAAAVAAATRMKISAIPAAMSFQSRRPGAARVAATAAAAAAAAAAATSPAASTVGTVSRPTSHGGGGHAEVPALPSEALAGGRQGTAATEVADYVSCSCGRIDVMDLLSDFTSSGGGGDSSGGSGGGGQSLLQKFSAAVPPPSFSKTRHFLAPPASSSRFLRRAPSPSECLSPPLPSPEADHLPQQSAMSASIKNEPPYSGRTQHSSVTPRGLITSPAAVPSGPPPPKPSKSNPHLPERKGGYIPPPPTVRPLVRTSGGILQPNGRFQKKLRGPKGAIVGVPVCLDFAYRPSASHVEETNSAPDHFALGAVRGAGSFCNASGSAASNVETTATQAKSATSFPSSVSVEEQTSLRLAFGQSLTQESWLSGTSTLLDVGLNFESDSLASNGGERQGGGVERTEGYGW